MLFDPALSTLFCVVALLLLGLALMLMFVRMLRQPSQAPVQPPVAAPRPAVRSGQPYAPISTLLTAAEQDFFAVLRTATPAELLICPQVRLANLIRPTARNAKQNKYDFYRIQAKCVDFVLCDAATTAPRLVIELDDASHQRADRQQRDAFVDAVLAQVGLPILHVPWQRSYDPHHLAEAIRGLLGIVATLPVAAPEPTPILAEGWATPIKLVPQPVLAAPAVVPAVGASTYVCGQCQHEVRRESKFCNACGAVL